MSKKTPFAFLASLAVVAAATMVQANTVDLDTFNGSGWQVTRVLVGTETNTGGTSAAGVAEVTHPVYPIWINASAFGTGAKWVSWEADAADDNGYNGATSTYAGDSQKGWVAGSSAVNGTSYVYTKAFTLADDFTGTGYYSIIGAMSTDNWILSATLTVGGGTPINLFPYMTAPSGDTLGTAFEGTYYYAIDMTIGEQVFTSPTSFLLTITTVNNDPDGSNGPGPTGFIFGGTAEADPGQGATMVPLPAAAWAGMSLLAGLGLVRKIRARRNKEV